MELTVNLTNTFPQNKTNKKKVTTEEVTEHTYFEIVKF